MSGMRKTAGNFQIFLQTSQGLEVCFADKLLLFVGSVVIYTKNPIKINLLWMEKFLPGTGKFSIWLVSWDKYNFPSKLKPVLGSATANTQHSRNCRLTVIVLFVPFTEYITCHCLLPFLCPLIGDHESISFNCQCVCSLEMDFISASVVNDWARPPFSRSFTSRMFKHEFCFNIKVQC